MSKLRKTNQSVVAVGTISSSTSLESRHSVPAPMQPLTASEQYWATRALKAEALLSAQEVHYREMRTMGYSQDMKRSRELAILTQQHTEKHASLEKLIMLLTSSLLILVALLIYLATHHTRHASQVQRHWLAGLPSHFTIPILSPFTSVVEQETSVLGTRTIGIITLVAGCLAYFTFRHWLAQRLAPK